MIWNLRQAGKKKYVITESVNDVSVCGQNTANSSLHSQPSRNYFFPKKLFGFIPLKQLYFNIDFVLKCAVYALITEMHEMKHTFLRETIMRLVAEVGDEKKQSEKQQQIIGDLTLEKDTLEQKIQELEVDLENTRNKMKTSQEALSRTRENLEEREERLGRFFNWIQSGTDLKTNFSIFIYKK